MAYEAVMTPLMPILQQNKSHLIAIDLSTDMVWMMTPQKGHYILQECVQITENTGQLNLVVVSRIFPNSIIRELKELVNEKRLTL